jgi:hypothetical protein
MSDSKIVSKECCSYLVGKTIARVQEVIDEEFDDRDCMKITFTDGSDVWISAFNQSFTGASRDEYPVHLHVSELSENDSDVKGKTLVVTNKDCGTSPSMNDRLTKTE